jgi:DNA-binding CsgD family transcriptional regulator
VRPKAKREAQVVKLVAHGLINREIADRLDLSIKTIFLKKFFRRK